LQLNSPPSQETPSILSEQSRAEQSSSLLPATSQHGYTWHRAPLGPMAICLFSVKTFVFFFFFRYSTFDKKGEVGLFFIIDVPLLHLIPILSVGLESTLYSLVADPTENTVSIVIAQQYFDCCLRIRCGANLLTKALPSNEYTLAPLFRL
jgi:hypothetical protein